MIGCMCLRPAALALLLAASTLAWGQAAEQPERILRLNYFEGDVSLRSTDRLLVRGDRVTTLEDGRAELLLDASAIRLGGETELRVVHLTAARVQFGIERGTVNLQLRGLLIGERLELTTANVTVAPREPGEYRLEARAADQAVLTVHAGAAEVETSGGTVRVSGGQRVVLEGSVSRATLVPPVPGDAFDDWVLDREVLLANENLPRGPAEYVSDAPAHDGRWYEDSTYGRVWLAETSISSSSSSFFFGFSSGHWVFLGGPGRWCWVPERPVHLPQFPRETHPYGRPRTVVSQSGGSGGSITTQENYVRRSGFGFPTSVSSQSSGSTTTTSSSSGTRSSASYGRPRSTSSSTTSSPASIYAGPGNR